MAKKGGKESPRMGGFYDMKTNQPDVSDKSRMPIGSKFPHVDEGADRKDVSKQQPTVGPRTA